MKKSFHLILFFLFFSTLAQAQTKALKADTVLTPTIQCDMCKTRIEQYLKRIDGVTYANVIVKRKYAVVKYLTDRTNSEVIKTAVANSGYDVAKKGADGQLEVEINANPDFYKLLPKCCKKPEDGGGMPKQ